MAKIVRDSVQVNMRHAANVPLCRLTKTCAFPASCANQLSLAWLVVLLAGVFVAPRSGQVFVGVVGARQVEQHTVRGLVG